VAARGRPPRHRHDQVEDVLGADIRSEVHVITPTEDIEVDIPGRDPSTIPADELHEKLPVTAPAAAPDGDGASAEADALTGAVAVAADADGTEMTADVDVAAASFATANDLEIDPALIEMEPMEPVAAVELPVEVATTDDLAGVAMTTTPDMPDDLATTGDDTTFDPA
jgi:hypothetical protein